MRFNNPKSVLRWAYETTNTPILRISPPAFTVRRSSNKQDDFDRHAQAALIIARCERVLSPLHMDYIRVQFGREASGFESLSRHLAANFGAGIYARRAIEIIIRAYCGEKIGLREIRKALACGMLKAASLRNQGYDQLDALHSQAMEILELELKRWMDEEIFSVAI